MTNYPATGYPSNNYQNGPGTVTAQQLAQEDQVHNEKRAQNERKRSAAWLKALAALAAIAAIVYAAIKLWTFVPWIVDGANQVSSRVDNATDQVTQMTETAQ